MLSDSVAEYRRNAQTGELHTAPGYNRESHVFYEPPVGLDIPPVGEGWDVDKDARQRDLEEAKRLLVEEVLADFPFCGWDRERIMDAFEGVSDEPLPPSLMNALAAMVEPFVRAMIAGPTPALLVTKPAAGTGATYLVNALQLIAHGRSNTRSPLPASEEERQKLLAVAVASAEPIILFDNQARNVDSPTLASVLTSTAITARTLGESAERTIPVQSTVAFTTNNARFSEEIQRRLSLVRLDAKMPEPKLRGGYRHADLHEWIAANRGRLIWAVLTLVQNWIALGARPSNAPGVASYQGWVYVLGGILEAADPERWTRFQGNRDQITQYAAAGEEDGLELFIAAWKASGVEKSAAELACLLTTATDIEIDGLRRGPDGDVSAITLGRFLGAYVGRRFLIDGVEVEITKHTDRTKTTVWTLVEHEKPARAVATGGTLGPRRWGCFPLTGEDRR